MVALKKPFVAAALALAFGSALAADIPTQKLDKDLAARVPAAIRDAGVLRNAVNGTFVPYTITKGNNEITGATADFSKAIGEILGLKVVHTPLQGLSAVLLGIRSGRYDVTIAPVGDFPDREQQNDFFDYVQEYVVFAVKKGNPKKINDIADTCGLKVSVMAAGSAERTIRKQSEECVKIGKKPVTVMSFEGQAAPMLAVRSGRADAFFSSQAPLTYFVNQDKAHLEVAAVGRKNGFSDLYQGGVVAKGSPLGPVLLDAFKIMHKNGTYEAIMKKWGLDNNILATPGMNLAGSAAKK